MPTIFDVVGAVGVAGTFYFGIRSLLQSGDAEALQKALRAYNQALFNNLWYIGNEAEQTVKATTLEDAKRISQGVAAVSQTARHTVVAFGEEHALKKPYYEPAWEPKPLAPTPKAWYRKIFRI